MTEDDGHKKISARPKFPSILYRRQMSYLTGCRYVALVEMANGASGGQEGIVCACAKTINKRIQDRQFPQKKIVMQGQSEPPTETPAERRKHSYRLSIGNLDTTNSLRRIALSIPIPTMRLLQDR